MNLTRKEFIEKVNDKYNLGLHNFIGVNDVRHHFNLNYDLHKQLDCFFHDLLNINNNFLSYESISIKNKNSDISFNYHELYDILIDNNILYNDDVIIYRLENLNDNNGLFVSNIGNELKEYYNSTTQPSPLEDSLLKSIFYDLHNREFSKNWYFAFSKIEDIHKWLGKDYDKESYELSLDLLIKNNVSIVEYEVNASNILETEHQTCFLMDKAKKINCYTFKNIKKNKISY